jgi:hypothetical protein
MTEADRVEYLAGQVHALLTFAAALMNTHPAQARLKREFQRLEKVAVAQTESRPVKEAFLVGQQQTNESLMVLLSRVAPD